MRRACRSPRAAFGISVPGYTLRGQRQLEALATQDPSVVVYFADVPYMRPHGTNGAFYDLRSVQVLKGPQGTLFGRNTTGGAVLMSPRMPGRQFGGEIDVEAGDYSLLSSTGILNVPLGDTLAASRRRQIKQRDGYSENLFNGRSSMTKTAKPENRTIVATDRLDRLVHCLSVLQGRERRAGLAGDAGQSRGRHRRHPRRGRHDAANARNAAKFRLSFRHNDVELRKRRSWSVSNTTSWEIGGLTLKNIAGYREVETFIPLRFRWFAATFTVADRLG